MHSKGSEGHTDSNDLNMSYIDIYAYVSGKLRHGENMKIIEVSPFVYLQSEILTFLYTDGASILIRRVKLDIVRKIYFTLHVFYLHSCGINIKDTFLALQLI